MTADHVPKQAGFWVVIIVLAVVAGACGTPGSTSDANAVGASGSEATDSPPGETAADGAGGQASTSAGVDVDSTAAIAEEDADSASSDDEITSDEQPATMTGAAVLAAKGFSDFSGKRVGLIASRASVVDGQSVIDLLADADGVELTTIFAAEHGIRGGAGAGAGEVVADEIDEVTGRPVFSLYGATRSPTPEMLSEVDVLVFDLQDVGTRFYTYTATMGLAMQAAAANDIPFVVLDRPNPLGGVLVDGSLREDGQESFVSQYPVPSVHGMTAAELARAIKGEGWLSGLADLELRVAPLAGWDRSATWDGTGLSWVAPSPGLPTSASATTYPTTVLFEATTLSYGRGTELPFGQVGAPWLDGPALAAELNGRALPGVRFEAVSFTPVSSPVALDPQFEGQTLPGVSIDVTDQSVARPAAVGVHLLQAVLAQAAAADPAIEVIDRPEFLDLLTGTVDVRRSLEAGRPAAEIVAEWDADLDAFRAVRAQYLLY